MNFNENWRFQRELEGNLSEAYRPEFDDSSWRVINVPHDWSIELDFNPDSPATHEGGFLDGGIGWYRKTFTVPESMKGKRISIDFDGVYMNSTTYLNGEVLGTYPFGYNAFSYDLTDKLRMDEENVIVVKVDNTQPSSRWYSGSGIYRNVHLTAKNPIHVARYGTFVTTPELETAYEKGRADINIKTKVKNSSEDAVEIKVQSTILNQDGIVVSTIVSDSKVCTTGETLQFEDNTEIENPILWDLENPYRYKLISEVLVGEKIVDTYETPFGVRYFEFDANEGFSLNGRYMKLHGVCMHHDLGALGAATNKRAVERQMQIMRDMGANAIRVTHNPASPELLEICNGLGLLVIEEAFDCWALSKKTYDYGRFFNEWAEHDIKEMVDRGKNEPCIIMWSIGNEIYDTTSENGVVIAKNLVSWVKEIDTTRPTTIGEDKTRGDKVNVTDINPHIEEIFNTVDIIGFNYSENNYAGYHEHNPNWKLYGAETSSATRSRGVYSHPYDYNLNTHYDDLQQSSYDNDYVAWGRTAEDAWRYDRDLKHIAGQFIWTGFDYIGEPTPYYNTYPAKSSYFGAVDTAGFPKDVFYYYQSQWKKEPMVHLLPHWNWNEGETVRVLAYTNADKVELFLNGESLGESCYELKKTSWGSSYKETAEGKTYLEWAVPFKAGKLEAVAKDCNGEVVARDQVVTAGEPAAVRLTADRRVIKADGTDLAFITVDVVDSEGNFVPSADNLVQFEISGDGVLAGVDNGDAASVERFKDNKRKAFSGKALAILQSAKNSGEITFSVYSEGLESDSVRVFTASPAEEETRSIVGVDLIGEPSNTELPTEATIFYGDGTVATRSVDWNYTSSVVKGIIVDIAEIHVTFENGNSKIEYNLVGRDKNPTLVSAELIIENKSIVEDDMIDLKIKGKLDNGDGFDVKDAQVQYHFDNDKIKFVGNKLYALSEGEVKISATLLFKGVTVRTAEIKIMIEENPTEKFIQKLESVTVIVDQGEKPHLPKTIVAHYNRGLPRDVEVDWEEVDPASCQKLGIFTVHGKVNNTDIQAVANVNVRGLVAIEHVTMAVLKNQLPEMPETVTVYFSDGTEKQTNVIWEEAPQENVHAVGEFKILGTVSGTELKASATIRVTEKIGGQHNIGRAKNGYDYPKAEASFTNPESSDRVEAIHDDVISYESEPHNRWTNWQQESRSSDWVSITFGDFEPEEFFVDNVEIHWFEDEKNSYPAAFTVQYKSCGEWKDVSNFVSELPEPALRQSNVYTFDLVKTSAIRVNMVAKPVKGIAITEMKVFSKWAAAFSEPKVSDIILNEESILERFNKVGDTFELTVEVDRNEVPAVSAIGQDNTGVTVVPTVTAPGTTKVIARSEDGKRRVVYNIHFIVKE
ncbi:Ig-like domain-containing protein [Lederbergia wuyishanensis]|uniref:Beta-galactosidase/beta-glucuronidase n=1 Tax=Lederbergia wuyishanensis TaxID=1347903 RepID=A0ABU0D5J6_9BACI|nr:Ig-like domain-containing protein [Lederbergia wuyishanensis]MCJ8009830.1 Ig-like domain-containing protein [Lederbergia wuyishanensis]MDQ0343687.1 beta-galactosidase/beta-glucuronidase [Lederbergia wuyishanensis]